MGKNKEIMIGRYSYSQAKDLFEQINVGRTEETVTAHSSQCTLVPSDGCRREDPFETNPSARAVIN